MTGIVYLAGSGPGDPDLLTVKARRLITTADVVMYDALTGSEIVETIPSDTRRIDVGKTPGDGSRTSQETINRLLVDHATAGRTVVRLKGGDPTVFGRGGEEAQHLAAAGVPFEFVPGVSSILAAPEMAGIPLTHRELSSTLTVITGHEDPTKRESAIDWSAIADSITAGGTLVILMGVRRLPENVAMLRKAGVPADMPVAMIERATRADETTVVGSLSSIVERARLADISPPACTVIGPVVSVHDEVTDHLHDATPVGHQVLESVSESGPGGATGILGTGGDD